MKLAPLTTFLVLTSSIASIASAAPVATPDARIPTWNSAAAGASRAGSAPQPDIIPPHASGPGKPAYVDFCNNPNVIKNAPCKPSREAEVKAASEFATQAGLPDKRDVAGEEDEFVHSGLESLERRGVPLILADPGRPVHQNVWHEINRAQHQAEKKIEKRLKPQPVFGAVGNVYVNGVKIRDTNTKREVKNLPKLGPQPVYDAEGNAYLNGVMLKDTTNTNTKREAKNPSPVFDMQGNTYINGVMIKAATNTKREVKNLPKLEPEPNQDLYGRHPKAPEFVPSGKKPSSANPPAKPGQNPPVKFARKGKPSFKEWMETYGYENVLYKRDVPGNQDASHGLAPLVEQQEAHHQHDPASHHAAPADFAAAADQGEHGDGSVHDAVKEGEEAKKLEEKRGGGRGNWS